MATETEGFGSAFLYAYGPNVKLETASVVEISAAMSTPLAKTTLWLYHTDCDMTAEMGNEGTFLRLL
jgi:hypothetical protein